MPCALPPQATYHIVNQAVVSEVETLQEAPKRSEEAPQYSDLPDVNRDIVRTREERTLARAQTERASINENVAMGDQVVFSELCKTMPCEWMAGPSSGERTSIRLLRRRKSGASGCTSGITLAYPVYL